eukprot:scaffold12231_cov103-Isochrysis_galbana.AAC.9
MDSTHTPDSPLSTAANRTAVSPIAGDRPGAWAWAAVGAEARRRAEGVTAGCSTDDHTTTAAP